MAVGIALTLWAIPGSIYSAVLAENFPTRIRTRGIGVAYALSFRPVRWDGSVPQPAVRLDRRADGCSTSTSSCLCPLTFVATMFMRETKGIDLKDA